MPGPSGWPDVPQGVLARITTPVLPRAGITIPQPDAGPPRIRTTADTDASKIIREMCCNFVHMGDLSHTPVRKQPIFPIVDDNLVAAASAGPDVAGGGASGGSFVGDEAMSGPN